MARGLSSGDPSASRGTIPATDHPVTSLLSSREISRVVGLLATLLVRANT
jgi:hypothetical protein